MGDGRWQKGQSGNPRGRPQNDEWTAWFASAQWTAFCSLVRQSRQNGNLAAANTASMYISDVNMGKPTVRVDATVTHDLAHQHLLAVAAANGVPLAELATAAPPTIDHYDPPGPMDPLAHELPLFDQPPPSQSKPMPEPEIADVVWGPAAPGPEA